MSSFYEEYLENQCTNGEVFQKLHQKPHSEFSVSKSDFCSYEEYENATLRHVDELIDIKTKEECQSLCDNSAKYNCRGYSLLPSSITGLYTCYLHSEDTKVHGPKLLVAKPFSKYFERARCLNSETI